MRKIALLFVAFGCLSFAVAQTGHDTAIVHSQRPKVGLALGGGGAKGAAHIGVLKYMEEIGIPVDYVVGTSIGSIIGGLYALGYSPDELAELISNMDWELYMSNGVDRKYQSAERRERNSEYILSIPFGTGEFQEKSGSLLSSLPRGIINGASLINLFSTLSVGYNDSVDFKSLPIPFACVATDILNGDSVVLRSGNFAKAIRASMAIPGMFSPIKWNKYLLADGGLVNNFPVDVCLSMGADMVIGVEFVDSMADDPSQLQSLPQQIRQYLNIAVRGNSHVHRQMCDVYLHPDVTGYGTLSFTSSAIDTLIQRGYNCAKAHELEFLELKRELEKFGPCQKELQAPRAKLFREKDTFVLAEIVYKGVAQDELRWLTKKDDLEAGVPMTMEAIARAIGVLNGTGAYSMITYNLYETDEEMWLSNHVYTDVLGRETYRLVINLESAEPHLAAIGFRYDSEESSSLLFHIGWNEQRLSGFKLRASMDLNYNACFKVCASWCGLGIGDVSLAYKYHNSSLNVNDYDSYFMKGRLIDHHNISLFISEFHLFDFSFAFGIDEDFYSNRYNLSLNRMLHNGIFRFSRTDNYFGTFFRGRYDNLDNAYFATKGVYSTLTASWRKNNQYLFKDVDSGFVDINFKIQSYITPTPRFTIIPQTHVRMLLGQNPSWYDNIAGGTVSGRYLDHQMAFVGLNTPLYLGDMAGILRLDLRYRIFGRYYLYLMANQMASFDKDDPYNTLKTTFGAALRFAYDSPLGPVSLDLHWNDFSRRLGAYINIGYIF